MHPQSHAMSIGWRRPAWMAFLAAASIGFSLGFACAAPFAAIAAAAALTLDRRRAMVLVGALWLANQGIGFGVLHYPWTVDSLAWGGGLGVIALISVLAAEFGAKHLAALNAKIAPAVAFLSAFAAYEGILFIVSLMSQSGAADYTLAIAARIFAINAAAFAGLLAANKLGKFARLRIGDEGPQPMSQAAACEPNLRRSATTLL